ncbi:MAG TPA: LmbU family transcriptional regulator [Streptosporangiaceae bacterium]|nr:LmbU family transcriptional regulator [Streptosporangiaceae bacterium]
MSSLQAARTQPGRLRVDRVALTKRTALSLPENLPLDSWKQIGEQIHIISDASAWWIGDWLRYGRDKYPDRYKRAIGETSLEYQTLRNYAWVAGRFDPSRRRDGLSFQHHLEVAALPQDQQDLWLERAERSRWSRNDLRAELRCYRDDPAGIHPLPMAAVQLRVPAERRQLWQDAAARAGLELQEWMSTALDLAAKTELGG